MRLSKEIVENFNFYFQAQVKLDTTFAVKCKTYCHCFVFLICLPPGFLSMLGPTERWCCLLILGAALLWSSRAGSDEWLYPGFCILVTDDHGLLGWYSLKSGYKPKIKEPALQLHSRAALSVVAHHWVNSPDTGKNYGGRRKKNLMWVHCILKYVDLCLHIVPWKSVTLMFPKAGLKGD